MDASPRTPPGAAERFSGRAERYARFRPGYPDALLRLLEAEAGLTPSSVVADVGSGTGLSAEPFLRNGNPVIAVEPNGPMREAAERRLSGRPGLRSVAGTAEATTLPPGSVDFVVAAQAFHWFDPSAARREFRRILRPDGWAVLLWNTRRTAGSPFLAGFEALLERFGTDYREVRHTNLDPERLRGFFDAGTARRRVLGNEQLLDYEGLEGRLLSMSFIPQEDDPRFEPVRAALRRLFDRHAEAGAVRIEYDLEVYLGRVRDG